jgi:hypothetical protein
MQHLKKFSSYPKFDKGRRKQVFVKILKMSTAGKESVSNFFDNFRAPYFPPSSVHKPKYVERWVGVSEKTTQGLVYINTKTITLIWKANTTDLLNSTRTLRSMINTYQNFCQKVDDMVTLFDKPTQQKNKPSRSEVEEPQYHHPFDIYFLPFKYQILDAPQVCKEMEGRQPEIRD